MYKITMKSLLETIKDSSIKSVALYGETGAIYSKDFPFDEDGKTNIFRIFFKKMTIHHEWTKKFYSRRELFRLNLSEYIYYAEYYSDGSSKIYKLDIKIR